jgi:hypothetical protein
MNQTHIIQMPMTPPFITPKQVPQPSLDVPVTPPVTPLVTPPVIYDAIPSGLHILLRKLQFIAMTEAGQRPMFSTLTYSQAGLFGAVMRTWYGESRTSLLASINQTYEECSKVLLQDCRHVGLLVDHIQASRAGIERLAETYSASPDVVSSLMITMVNIDIIVLKYSQR